MVDIADDHFVNVDSDEGTSTWADDERIVSIKKSKRGLTASRKQSAGKKLLIHVSISSYNLVVYI